MKYKSPNVKNINRSTVLKIIMKSEGISRAEIARMVSLTKPTVSRITNEFIESGYILETGKGESKGGKRPRMLVANKDAFYVIGIDLADDKFLRGVLCDFTGTILHKEKIQHNFTYKGILKELFKLIEFLMDGRDSQKLAGIGLAVSGIVDRDQSKVIASSNFDLIEKDLTGGITKKFSVPVILENRPNAAALAEKRYGLGSPFTNMVFLTSGRGVGAGIICNGKMYGGSFGGAGEIQNIRVGNLSSFAEYDKTSTVEYMSSEEFIVSKVNKSKEKKLNFSSILKLYDENDKDVAAEINRNAEYIAYSASVIANILNPEAIILGGQVVEFGEKYLEHFKSVFVKHLIAPELNRVKVYVSKFGRDGVAYGGAALILDEIINFNIL
ncbi:MAG: ROK family transcriptional regulator [Verrucomicrobiota bacterium]|nr:ROK family transcriptional regulator [Verrucomicrobiota bacterium]